MSKNSGKAPSIQFYFKDWLANIKLKRISKAAKGVWIDLVCWSCCMPKMGVFFDGNKPFSEQEVVDLLDGKQAENKRCLKQLLERNIIKKFDDGEYKNALYVKRVYKDICLRDIRVKAGKQGGNPNLVGDLVNQKGKQTPTPSISPSSSPSSSTPIPKTDIGIITETPDADLDLGLEGIIQKAALLWIDAISKLWVLNPNEKKTFNNARLHLMAYARTQKHPEQFFSMTISWAKLAHDSQCENTKGLYIKKLKDETGFVGNGKLLTGSLNQNRT